MSKSENAVSYPIFHEPVFSENKPTHDPTGFLTDHPSDTALYKQVDDLLKKQVVGFAKSRVEPDQLFTLDQAYGPRGKDVVEKISNAGRIVFHAIGVQARRAKASNISTSWLSPTN